MKYEHPTIQCETPAPGHYLISGHAPRPVLLAAGYLVPPGTVHISPELPSALLRAILEDRGDEKHDSEPGRVEGGTAGPARTFQPVVARAQARGQKTPQPAHAPPKPKGRRPKATATNPQPEAH